MAVRPEAQRCKILRISQDSVLNWMDGHWHRIDSGLPRDAEVIAVQYAYPYACFDFLVWSQSFDLVPELEQFPVIETAIGYDMRAWEEPAAAR